MVAGAAAAADKLQGSAQDSSAQDSKAQDCRVAWRLGIRRTFMLGILMERLPRRRPGGENGLA